MFDLPRQLNPEQAEAIQIAIDSVENAANAIATSNIALNLSLSMTLKFLWGMINTLQFIVFFTEWKV